MNTVIVTIRLPAHASGIGVASDLVRRFGDDNVDVTIESEPDELDDNDVDPEMLLTILRNASERMSDVPEAQRQLTELVYALQAPPAERIGPLAASALVREAQASTALDGETQSIDEAPPHGIPRPSVAAERVKEVQVKATDDTPSARRTKRVIINDTTCPKCGASAGRPCQSPNGYGYGSGHVHQQRIDRWYGR
jgi:hypothetical protein